MALEQQLRIRRQAEEQQAARADLHAWSREMNAQDRQSKGKGALKAAAQAPVRSRAALAAPAQDQNDPRQANGQAGGGAHAGARAGPAQPPAGPKQGAAHTYSHYGAKWDSFDYDQAMREVSDDEEGAAGPRREATLDSARRLAASSRGLLESLTGGRAAPGPAPAADIRARGTSRPGSSRAPVRSAQAGPTAPAAAAAAAVPAAAGSTARPPPLAAAGPSGQGAVGAAAGGSSSGVDTHGKAPAAAAGAAAEAWKEEGNRLFKAGDFSGALGCYNRSIKEGATAVAWANKAMALLRLQRHGEAEEAAGAALALDPGYVKAWQRRGAARRALGAFLEAAQDVEEALRLQIGNKALAAERAELLELARRQDGLTAPTTKVRIPITVVAGDPQGSQQGAALAPSPSPAAQPQQQPGLPAAGSAAGASSPAGAPAAPAGAGQGPRSGPAAAEQAGAGSAQGRQAAAAAGAGGQLRQQGPAVARPVQELYAAETVIEEEGEPQIFGRGPSKAAQPGAGEAAGASASAQQLLAEPRRGAAQPGAVPQPPSKGQAAAAGPGEHAARASLSTQPSPTPAQAGAEGPSKQAGVAGAAAPAGKPSTSPLGEPAPAAAAAPQGLGPAAAAASAPPQAQKGPPAQQHAASDKRTNGASDGPAAGRPQGGDKQPQGGEKQPQGGERQAGAAPPAKFAAALGLAERVAGRVAKQPGAPRTGTEFEAVWRSLRGDPGAQLRYLQLLHPPGVPLLLKEALTGPLLGSILLCLLGAPSAAGPPAGGTAPPQERAQGPSGATPPAHPPRGAGWVLSLLEGLRGVPRFQMAALGMGGREKREARAAWGPFAAECPQDVQPRLAALRKAYCL